MPDENPFRNVPIIYDLPRPFLGFPKVAVDLVDGPARTITFRLADAAGVPREENNTARFDGTYETAAILADIINDLEAHA